jgi:hypothetical protein
MPCRLHLDKELTAKENVLADNHLQTLRELRATTSQCKQATFCQKRETRKRSKQQMGPLTFDVNPELEEDEHVYLAAVDNQAKLMRWHYRLGHLASSNLS